ncbi:Wzt carbohydrate-binding domain-containing protein [Rubrivivax sp. JA1055]|uniref:Wzt carbohydrate-binding domain-containing protein n=1 Tax=Rubrivivax sp. JA1055 TaxID=2894194 RepID=UPI001E4E19F7|nr:Wzt carbohydrate-binding domain-containing protein [Rubrivivax sp. JA1055]MCC9595494.1 Wzt carbohydrate-binding domain-containing protein [Rubrivivax sp. JA1055]
MKRFSRIVVHVGPEKTGSTAIQTAFDLGREAIAEAGVLYPRGGWHAQLGSCFAERPEQYIYNVLSGRLDPASRARQDAEYLAGMEDEFRSSACGTVLLSYEGFASLDAGGLRNLAAYLRTWSDRVEVLGYCREPLGYALSAASQRVRSGVAPWEPVPVCPYADYYEALAGAFGLDNLSVHAFDRSRLADGDVVSDVARFLGLDDATTMLLRSLGREGENPTLSALAMEVGQRLAERCLAQSPVGEAFHVRFSTALSLLGGPKGGIPDGLHAAIVESAAPHTRYLERQFGIVFAPPHGLAGAGQPGPDRTVVDVATELIAQLTSAAPAPPQTDFDGDVCIVGAELRPGGTITTGSLVTMEVQVEIRRKLTGLVAGLHVRKSDGSLAYGTNTQMLDCGSITAGPGRYTATHRLLADLEAGAYTVGFSFSVLENGAWQDLCWRHATLRFEVLPPMKRNGVGSRDLVAAITMRPASSPGRRATTDVTLHE